MAAPALASAKLRYTPEELLASHPDLAPQVEAGRRLHGGFDREGLGQSFWNTLTITGKIEARGRVLADIAFPEFSELVVEDVSDTALGHLNRGLLRAHGLDEGGEPERGIGGHDVMWFALRDLAFGETGWPDPAVPEIIRAETERRVDPEIPDRAAWPR